VVTRAAARSGGAALAAAVAVAACGGGAARPRGPGAAHAGGDVSTGEAALTLYRDGALVRERHVAPAGAGRRTVVVPLPVDVDAGDLEIRVVRGAAAVVSATVRAPALTRGELIEVRDGDRVVRGTLAEVTPDQIVLVDERGGLHALLDPRHVVRLAGGAPARHAAAIELEPAPGEAGEVELEVVYVTRALKWRADYTLVMDSRRGRAQLHGNLGIDNATGLAWDDAAITLIDGERPVKLIDLDGGAGGGGGASSNGGRAPKKVADPTKPRAEQPAPVAAPATPRTALPFPVDVALGAQAVALLGAAHELPARATLVYDPVGDERNLTGKEPIRTRDYGLDRRSTAVSQSFDVDLKAARIPEGLPAGRVRLVERTRSGALTPLGEARIFERASSGSEEVSPTTSIAVGRAGHVEAKRTRREFTLDEDGKRLIEEFEITLTSTADHPVEVTVREHLYRGLNWTLPYHNVGAAITKEGPQKVAMRTTVPAGGQARVIYRIIYYW
jgi:hypothetical protein